MKKILIITSKQSENKKSLVSLLNEKLGKGFQVNLWSWASLSFEIEKDKLAIFLDKENIKNYDLVYIRNTKGFFTLAKTVALCLEQFKIKFFDKMWSPASYFGDKLTNISRLALSGINIPKTIYSYTPVGNFCLSQIIDLGFPIIIKKLEAQAMQGIYVARNEGDLETFLSKHKDEQFLFQKYIEIEQEYRLLVVGGKTSSAHTKSKRAFAGDRVVYSNINEWHKFVDLKVVPVGLIKMAEEAADRLLLDIAGVDVCVDKKGSEFLIEVNRGPGLDYDPDSPEIKALVTFFESKLKK